MKAKHLALVVMVVLMSFLALNGRPALASSPALPPALPGSAVGSLIAALNAGNTGAAASDFDKNAVVQFGPGGKSYVDAPTISKVLASWEHDGRQYQIVDQETITVARGVDIVTALVQISDSGIPWGLQRIRAMVYNGKIDRLDVLSTQVVLGEYTP